MPTNNNLPEDVIVQILLRLPVKPLVRFRCVSERWFSLISDPRFAKSHFKRVSEHTQRLLLSSLSETRSLDFHAPFEDNSALTELVLPFKQPGLCVSILGSCNGLVCMSFYNHSDFYIWNPSTGDHRKLPDPWISRNGGTNPFLKELSEPRISPIGGTCIRGFGYDLSTDDYKLLVAACGDEPLISEAQFELFSLKTNSWKRIQDQEPDYFYEGVLPTNEAAGTLSNGALHWIVELVPPDFFEKIVAFDLTEEKFRKVPMPMDNGDISISTLTNLGGRLCFTCSRITHVNVWGMMEYGAQESWAKMFRVVCLEYQCTIIPLRFSRGDQLLAISNGKQLIRSNPEGEILERFAVCSDQAWCEAAVFVESLLSPNYYDGD